MWCNLFFKKGVGNVRVPKVVKVGLTFATGVASGLLAKKVVDKVRESKTSEEINIEEEDDYDYDDDYEEDSYGSYSNVVYTDPIEKVAYKLRKSIIGEEFDSADIENEELDSFDNDLSEEELGFDSSNIENEELDEFDSDLEEKELGFDNVGIENEELDELDSDLESSNIVEIKGVNESEELDEFDSDLSDSFGAEDDASSETKTNIGLDEYNDAMKAKRNAEYLAMLDKSMAEAEAGGFITKTIAE